MIFSNFVRFVPYSKINNNNRIKFKANLIYANNIYYNLYNYSLL